MLDERYSEGYRRLSWVRPGLVYRPAVQVHYDKSHVRFSRNFD